MKKIYLKVQLCDEMMFMRRFLLVIIIFVSFAASAVEPVDIWRDSIGHCKVQLFSYPAKEKDAPAVIVCPGGSYFWHDMETEGHAVAEWLNRNGIAAFVLKYRVAGIPAFITHYRLLARGNRYPDPQDDLRQALRYVRAHAGDYGVNPDSVGAMGFSAGGHLVMSGAEFFDRDDRPAFVVPVYPVVSMSDECTHGRSRRALLGDNRAGNRQMRDSLSLEKHVPADCVPVFLVNCQDDPVVECRNSELLDSALTAQGIVHEYHRFATGGHGFGASDTKGTAECRRWRQLFIDWFHKLPTLGK